MKLKASVVLMLIMLLVIGCSTSPRPIQPDTGQQSTGTDVPVYHEERDINFDENLLEMAYDQLAIVSNFGYALTAFRQVNGSLPDSMSSLINSGILMWWPRNLMSGTPANLIQNRDFKLDSSDFGSFKYEIIENPPYQFNVEDYYNCKFELQVISIDGPKYAETGNVIWKETGYKYPGSRSLNDRGTTIRRVLYGTHGKKSLYDVENNENKLMFAMCGNLAAFIQGRTALLYRNHDRLPNTFSDLFQNEKLIIRENFNKLSDMLNNSNANFIWGVDHSIGASYIVLEMDGETYMSGCRRFGDKEFAHVPDYGEYFDCKIENVDMSSPIITSENIVSTEIPEEYLISIKDIPLGN